VNWSFKPFVLLAVLLPSQIALGETAVAVNMERAKSNYMLNCQGCHQADGSGLVGSVPSMDGFVGGFLSVPGGRDFLVQVPGSANSPLSDAALAELLNWILITMSEEQLADDFQHYTEAEVAKSRQHTLVDVSRIRSQLVAKIQD
jgi:mono/diheme cytochrome c family protein